MKNRTASLIFILSMAIFGTLSPFVRNIPLSSGALSLCRAILACLLIGIYLIVKRQKILFVKIKKEIFLLFASGAAIGINWILLFEAYKHTTVALSTISYYFAPVIVVALSPVIFRERLNGKQILCFAASSLGLILITGTEGTAGGNNLVGILFGLGAALFYASVIILNKFIKNVDGIHRTLLQFISAAVVLSPYVFVTGGMNFEKFDAVATICLLIVGLLHTGITYCMYFSVLPRLSGQRASLLSFIDPLVAVLVSVTILGERMTAPQIIGGILILGFTLYNELPEKNIIKK